MHETEIIHMHLPNLLIIDPEANYKNQMDEVLMNKIDITYVSNIKDAIEKCWERNYELIMVETELPNHEDAFEFIEKVRQKMPQAMFIVLTKDGKMKDAVEAFQSGAIDFIAKPVNVKDILSILTKFQSLTSYARMAYDVQEMVIEERRSFILPTDFYLINLFLDDLMQMIQNFPNFNKSELRGIRFSLYEMIVNAMEHGNLEINYEQKKSLLEEFIDYYEYLESKSKEAPYRDRKVWFTYHYMNNKITFEITDEGPGFDVSNVPSPKDAENINNLNGRGILITKINMDEVTYNDKGNSVILVKYLTPKEDID